MFESNSTKDRIVSATLRLAAKESWNSITLNEIAEEAGVNLTKLREDFSCKSEILARFSRKVDDVILSKSELATSSENARDRLFDVVMTRLETLTPYKEAIKNIVSHQRANYSPSIMSFKPFLCSQYWMLAAAGINAEGFGGLVRLTGLASTYASVFSIWLGDDDPGLAKTMAALDRRLRRGERWLNRLSNICECCCCLIFKPKSDGPKQTDESPKPTETPVEQAQPPDPGQSGFMGEPSVG